MIQLGPDRVCACISAELWTLVYMDVYTYASGLKAKREQSRIICYDMGTGSQGWWLEPTRYILKSTDEALEWHMRGLQEATAGFIT